MTIEFPVAIGFVYPLFFSYC